MILSSYSSHGMKNTDNNPQKKERKKKQAQENV